MIVAAAVFVEKNDQQRGIPVGAVSDGVVDRPDQFFAAVEIRRAEKLQQIAFRVHVVVRAPDRGVEIYRLDEGVRG